MNVGRVIFSGERFEDLRQITNRPDLLRQFSDFLRDVRRHLHAHPETGFQEYETSAFIRRILEANGLDVRGPIAVTGLYVDIDGTHPGRRVGYRADIDALPIEDEKQVPYRSTKKGTAHLCGHDAHTTIAIGVAILLNQLRAHFSGSIRILFQPNEEGFPSGAAAMINEGVLEGLEAIYALHVDPTLQVGQYGLIDGPTTAASDRFRVVVRGQATGHSARPHTGVDTVWVATQIVHALYQLVGRITDARNASVLTVTRFHGGDAYNVIPEVVEFGGTLRSTDGGDRALLKQKIARIAEHNAALYNAEVEVDIEDGTPPVVNDPELNSIVRKTIDTLFGAGHVYEFPRPSMGAEDFGHFLQYIPGALIRVGTSSGIETSYPVHDNRFDIDESVLLPTALLMGQVLLKFLTSSR